MGQRDQVLNIPDRAAIFAPDRAADAEGRGSSV